MEASEHIFMFICTCAFDLIFNWSYVPKEWKVQILFRQTTRSGKKNSNGKQPRSSIIEQMTHRPQIPAEVNKPQSTALAPQLYTQYLQLLGRTLPPRAAAKQITSRQAARAPSGAVAMSPPGWSKSQWGGNYFPHYLNYSPVEINAFSPVNRCSEQPAIRHSARFHLDHTGESCCLLWEAGEAPACERWHGQSHAKHGVLSSYGKQPDSPARPCIWRGRELWVTQSFVCSGEMMVISCKMVRAIPLIRWLRQQRALKGWVALKSGKCFLPRLWPTCPPGIRRWNFEICLAIFILRPSLGNIFLILGYTL